MKNYNKYFSKSEFQCPCCMAEEMDIKFIERLTRARMIAGVPFIINSGYRCKKNNDKLENSSPNSSHMKGIAADISAKDSLTRYKIIESLIRAGFSRIGVGKNFIHVDYDIMKNQEVFWTYYKEK